ncbi:MAG TPA: L-histidine N(alpha)-methyltransferase [Stellaceae bacterium]|nr:L-histidine N(alpha)-methyltransferase [Stellaceae bacterium]
MSARPVRATFHDFAPEPESFRDAVLAGLSQRHKEIPCRWLYDERGSALFEEICETPEYYPTRTETAILARHGGEIAAAMGPHCQLVEFGSGSSRKVRLLLSAFDRPSSYVAIDISREALQQAADAVATLFPRIDVRAVCADYMAPLDLAEIPEPQNGRRLGFFPGSTIGNLDRPGAIEFLRRCRRVVGSDGAMLVGVDLKKDARVLHAAYNDAAGVTASFTLNLLARINRELGGDFDVTRFAHDASYNPVEGKVEIFIRSLAEQTVTVADCRFRFAEGERIHTEDSCKYSVPEFQQLAMRAGFAPSRVWTDADALFSIHLLRPV